MGGGGVTLTCWRMGVSSQFGGDQGHVLGARTVCRAFLLLYNILLLLEVKFTAVLHTLLQVFTVSGINIEALLDFASA